MSLEILNQLEEKIKQAVETIQLLQLEVEELKEKNAESHRNIESLQTENEQLKNLEFLKHRLNVRQHILRHLKCCQKECKCAFDYPVFIFLP